MAKKIEGESKGCIYVSGKCHLKGIARNLNAYLISRKIYMKDLGHEMAEAIPRLSHGILARLMVPDFDLGSYLFPEISSEYLMGIGAVCVGDGSPFAGGIASEHPKGFELA